MSGMFNPPHPGEVLKDGVFSDADMTIAEFARRIGVSRVTLSRILNCKAAVSADMALRLADALGGSPESWLGIQSAYDLWQARKNKRPQITRIFPKEQGQGQASHGGC